MALLDVNTTYQSGLYYFRYAGRVRVVQKDVVTEYVIQQEQLGKHGMEISENLLVSQMTEIELDLSMLN